jgi:hypothetical protein
MPLKALNCEAFPSFSWSHSPFVMVLFLFKVVLTTN